MSGTRRKRKKPLMVTNDKAEEGEDMFAEVKELLTFVQGDEYDGKIISEIKACAADLTRTTEIVLPGEISITRVKEPATTVDPERWVITDASTVTDELVIKAIAVWCDKEIGNPPNYAQLQAAYESLKGSMKLSKHYTGNACDGEALV